MLGGRKQLLVWCQYSFRESFLQPLQLCARAHTHTRSNTQMCQCQQNAVQFYNQFGPEGGVGWCSFLQCKSWSGCSSNSASTAINSTSLITIKLGGEKNEFRQQAMIFSCCLKLKSTMHFSSLISYLTIFFCLGVAALMPAIMLHGGINDHSFY